MAAAQKKLVHKQFNSPIGLYSQQNVKETLNRELKAFGADGIEIDEQISKPLNLANSAVLRAVEEEEQMKCEHITGQRQSRARHRYTDDGRERPHTPLHHQQLEQIKTQYLSQQHQHDITIDRDTVLKINRLSTCRNLHKRDHSWPPPHALHACHSPAASTFNLLHQQHQQTQPNSNAYTRSSSNDNAVHFDEIVCRQHGIDAIREKFNSPTRIIEPTTKEIQQQRQKIAANKSPSVGNNAQHRQQQQQRRLNDNPSAGTLTNVANNKDNLSSTMTSTMVQAKPQQKKQNLAIENANERQQRQQQRHKDAADDADAIDADDEEFDEQRSPISRGFSAPETCAADIDIGLVELKLRYYEQLAAKKSPATATAPPLQPTKSMKPVFARQRQSCSLDRGRNKLRRQQLPPLKPRAGSVGLTVSQANANGNGTTTSSASLPSLKTPTAKLQRRSIKLATEIKICYDNDVNAVVAPNSPKTMPAITQSTPKDLQPQTPATSPTSTATVTITTDLEHIPLPPTPVPPQLSSTMTAQPLQSMPKAKPLDSRKLDTTPATDQVATNKKQSQLLPSAPINNASHQKHPKAAEERQQTTTTHRIPVTLEQSNESQNLQSKSKSIAQDFSRQHSRASGKVSTTPQPTAQQIYDDACIYLRSIDCTDNTVAYIPAAITIVPSSPTDDMLQRWSTAPETMTNTTEDKPQQPAHSEPAHFISSGGIQLIKRQQSLGGGGGGSPIKTPTTPTTPNRSSLRRQGFYCNDNEFIFTSSDAADSTATTTPAAASVTTTAKLDIDLQPEPDDKHQQQAAHANNLEIATLEAKYGQIQQSIAEHLRQIDSYMEHAKIALNRTLQQTKQQEPTTKVSSSDELWQLLAQQRQSPILVIESPLQAILRQLQQQQQHAATDPKAKSIPQQHVANEARPPPTSADQVTIENMPIVEQVLSDLGQLTQNIKDYETQLLQCGDDASQLRPMLERLVTLRSPTYELIQLEHCHAPKAMLAKHVNLNAEQEEQPLNEQRYEHVADVIANYEQLSHQALTAEQENTVTAPAKSPQPARRKPDPNRWLARGKGASHEAEVPAETAQSSQVTAEKAKSCSCQSSRRSSKASIITMQQADTAEDEAGYKAHMLQHNSSDDAAANCAICGLSKSNWGKLTAGDLWRLENQKQSDEALASYQANYGIPSPYVSRQISWEQITDAADVADDNVQHTNADELEPSKSGTVTPTNREVTPPLPPPPPPLTPTPTMSHPLKSPLPSPPADSIQQHVRPSPDLQDQPIRKYPAPLIAPDVPPRSASPFGLNALDSDSRTRSPTPTAIPQFANMSLAGSSNCTTTANNAAKHVYVPQVEGHNIGLLVHTAIAPHINNEHVERHLTLQLPQNNVANAIVKFDTQNAAFESDSQLNVKPLSGNIEAPTPLHAEQSSQSMTATSLKAAETNFVNTACGFAVSHQTNRETAAKVTTNCGGNSVDDDADANDDAEAVASKPNDHQRALMAFLTTSTVSEQQKTTAAENRLQATADQHSAAMAVAATSITAEQQQQQQQQRVAWHATQSTTATMRDFSGAVNRTYDNVSPRPYITTEGYKRVAWPPVSEERIIREFTPQPAAQQDSYQAQQQQQQQQQQQYKAPASAATAPAPAQGPIYNNVQPVQRQASPYPHQYQQQQPQQQQYQQPQQQQYQQPQQQQQQYQPPQSSAPQQYQQPIQYTQSQFNRQPSREPSNAPIAYQQAEQQPVSQNQYNSPQTGYPTQNNYAPQQPAQQQQQYGDPTYGNYQPNQSRDGSSPYPGWKQIRPPTAKAQPQYQAPSANGFDDQYAPSNYAQQQQYRAPSYEQAPQSAYQPQQQQQQPQQQPSWAQPRQQQQQQPPQQQQQYQAAPGYQQQQPGQYPPPAQAQQQYQPQPNPYSQQQQQQPLQQQQQQFYSSNPQVNYNSYSQPQQQQQQYQSPDQPDYQRQQQSQLREQSLPQDYRGASPGIITLRKEAPVTQKPAPVYTSQPAAVSYQGGSNMRGDLKWPPPEYKEAAQRENEERRQLALGPVCRPRKVNRFVGGPWAQFNMSNNNNSSTTANDYTNFFAKNRLNSYYPSYKVPPGTQHMLF